LLNARLLHRLAQLRALGIALFEPCARVREFAPQRLNDEVPAIALDHATPLAHAQAERGAHEHRLPPQITRRPQARERTESLRFQPVRCGGGSNHRFGLDDAILVKENHSVLAGGVGPATRAALADAPEGMMIVVECATLDEVDEALAAGAPHLLADNMSETELRETVERSAGRATVEASGGVNLDTVAGIAATGVDFISVGALTHSAPSLDLSLLLYT